MHASYDYGYDARSSSSFNTSVMTAPLLGTSTTTSLHGGAALLQPLRAAPIRCRVTRSAAGLAAAANTGPAPYVYAIDHLSTKLKVPMSAVVPTQAMEDDGLVPGLCRLYLEGRCRQGQRCFQVHADPAVVQQLRVEALQTPSCCHVHGAPCNYEGFPLGLTLTLEGSGAAVAAAAAAGGGGGRGNVGGERGDAHATMMMCTCSHHQHSNSHGNGNGGGGSSSNNSSFVCAACHGSGKMCGRVASVAENVDAAAAAAAVACERSMHDGASVSAMTSRCTSVGDLSTHANGNARDGAAAASMLGSASSYAGQSHGQAPSGRYTPMRHLVPCSACSGGNCAAAQQQQQQHQQPAPPSVVVALSSLCPTSYLWGLYKESGGAMHLRAPVSRVCREHRKGMCRFGDECNFLHICRETDIAQLVDHHHHNHHHHHGHRHHSHSSYGGSAASYQQGGSWSATYTEQQQQQQQQQQQPFAQASSSMTSSSNMYQPSNGNNNGGSTSYHQTHYSNGTGAVCGGGAAVSGAAAFGDGAQAQSMGGGAGVPSQRPRNTHGLVATGSLPYVAGNSHAGACSFMGNSASSSFAGVRSTLMASVRSFGNLAEDGGGSGSRAGGGPAPLLRPLSGQQSHCTNPPTRQNSFSNNPYADTSSLQ